MNAVDCEKCQEIKEKENIKVTGDLTYDGVRHFTKVLTHGDFPVTVTLCGWKLGDDLVKEETE